MIPRILLALGLLSCTLGARAEESPVRLGEVNDAVAFLAGVELPHRKDLPLAGASAWQTHVRQMDREFQSHEERVLHPMSAWSRERLDPDLIDDSLVRYLFSGPDILHAFHLFPTADTFVMCGLEPVGGIPDLGQLDAGNAGRALGEVRNALGEVINFSFFRTKDMKDDLRFSTFRGTTPLMMIFLARSGQYIKGVEFLSLKEDGSLASLGGDSEDADAVRIDFGPLRLENQKTLYYFSSDLSNGGFPDSGFRTWLEAKPKGTAYVKAASFLMHQDWFSEVRRHLLDYSVQVIQDDSGIPFRHFDSDVWEPNLYGVYTGPIDLFSEYYQSGLRAAYRRGATPLPFGTGYKWRKGQSNLMHFVRRGAGEAPPADADPTGPATAGIGE